MLRCSRRSRSHRVKSLTHYRIAIGSEIGVLVLLAVVAMEWRVFATEYQLFHLRKDPIYAFDLIDAEEGTPERAAFLRFVKTLEGKQGLTEAVVDMVCEHIASRDRVNLLDKNKTAIIGQGVRYAFNNWSHPIREQLRERLGRHGAVYELLSTARGSSFPL